MKNYLFAALTALIFQPLYSQNKAIGSWTDHLPYRTGKKVAVGEGKVYCATGAALFYIDKNDNSITRKSKVNGLSDVGISTLSFVTSSKTLVIAYNNGNIDLFKDDKIYNIPFLKNNLSITDKSINNTFVDKEFVYIACGFGILKLNTERRELSDSYIIGSNGAFESIFDITIFNDTMYAATSTGIKYASTKSNLTDYTNWKRETTLSRFAYKYIELFEDKLISVSKAFPGQSDSIYVRENGTWSLINGTQVNVVDNIKAINKSLFIFADNTIIKTNEQFLVEDTIKSYSANIFFRPNAIDYDSTTQTEWIADEFSGLVEINGSRTNSYSANGPASEQVFKIESKEGKVYTVPGGYENAYNNLYLPPEINILEEGNWKTITGANYPPLGPTFDLLNITIDPNDKDHVFIGTWGTGLLEFRNNLLVNKFDSSNSKIPSRQAYTWYGIGGTNYDENGNLWISNTYTDTAITVLTNKGEWYSYNFPTNISTGKSIGDILITRGGLKWVLIPRAGANLEILVFDDGGTLSDRRDDRELLLTSATGNGSLPGSRGMVGAVDQDGELWIGTDDGLAVFYNPDGIFEGNKDAQRILIQQGADVEILLEAIKISDIKIDGANRKWISTEGEGVFLISEDGSEELLHFTRENSPLISNSVFGLAIDDKTGEIFMATEVGIVSYKGDATQGFEDFNEVEIYPNPVRESYEGPIAIRGLVNNSIVKITDLNGKLVREIQSLGGQAIWDGKNINGTRVATGVYLVLTASGDGQGNLKTNISKLLVIN
tara:strand:- start:2355 stop:4679 length:2325 start_codon:yes stop_codon:yes gene_type:complete